ncbi:MAG TPA: hypothetical protein VIL74_07270 [Pyrinomonadaceae bacterium]|jgi:hypothetical protein
MTIGIKKKVLIVENQFLQFKAIHYLLNKAGFEIFPDENSFKEFLDGVRICLNTRYTPIRQNKYWNKILGKTIEYNPDIIIIDHILVGSHEAEDGIDLAIKFRKYNVKQPFIFFSRTDINNIDICDRLPKVLPKSRWIVKGYSGADILEPIFFEKKVIPEIEALLDSNLGNEQTSTLIDSSKLLRLKDKLAGLEKTRKLLETNVNRYRNEIIIESDLAIKIKLEYKLEEFKAELEKVEAEIDEIEKQINDGA